MITKNPARTAVQQALDAVAQARTYQTPAKTHCEAGLAALDGYEGHVQAVKFDRPDRDVSAHGKALRVQSQKAEAEIEPGLEQGTQLAKVSETIEERIQQALKNTASGNWQARNALDEAGRDQQMLETHSLPSFQRSLGGANKNLGQQLSPYLDEVEADAPGRDVGRFADDLKELFGDGGSGLREAKLATGWILQDLDGMESSLKRALQAL